jgi:multidrug resistance efflux pump
MQPTRAQVVDLVDDTRVEILVNGSAELARRVTEGAKATVRLDAQSVEAEVVGIVRALDRATRTAKLRLQPASAPPWLLAGSSVDVVFSVQRSGEGVVVPRDALVLGAVDTRVFEVVDGKAQPIIVQVVATADAEALVVGEGLTAGDSVVVRGNERLRPGQDVVVGGKD